MDSHEHQNRQHQDKRCQQSDVMECKNHIQKIHPLLAGVLIEKTCDGIDRNNAGGRRFLAVRIRWLF